MKRNICIAIIVIVMAFVYSGCAKKDNMETKSIEQIHKEQGVPVKVQVIEPSSFQKWLSYNATLQGIQQTSVSSMVQARVEKVNASVGDYVEEGDVLVEFPIDTPSAKYQQAKSAYENSQTTFERLKKLYDIGGISKQDLDGAETAYKVNKANWEAARQMLKAEAPISGFVTNMDVRVSDNVYPGDLLFEVSDMNKMKSRIWATEQEVYSITQGMKATATWRGHTLNGTVTQIALSLDRDSQAFPVDIVFENPNDIQSCGITVKIRILTYDNADALKVERKNIRTDENGSFVYIAQNGKAVKKYITIGEENGTEVEAQDGIKAGDQIITEGLNMVKDDDKIKVIH